MGWFNHKVAQALSKYLQKSSPNYFSFSTTDSVTLRKVLKPADILLVEGNQRISNAIKYLTQSTWSHAAIYVDNAVNDAEINDEQKCLVEADLNEGIIAVPLSKYARFNTRICRPVNLADNDRQKVIHYVVKRIGQYYDIKNVIDLMRYLLPNPPVPVRWRRRMLSLGSGDPTRAICSTLIAQAYQSVQYPILPTIKMEKRPKGWFIKSHIEKEILHIRHHSLFAPRDFDISPYFEIVKPTLVKGFNYKKLVWEEIDTISSD